MISFSSVASGPSLVYGVSPSVSPLTPAKAIEQVVKDDLSTIPGVLNVVVEHENEEILVRVGVNSPERELRYKIYDKQAGLIEAFPEMIFDFSLVHAE